MMLNVSFILWISSDLFTKGSSFLSSRPAHWSFLAILPSVRRRERVRQNTQPNAQPHDRWSDAAAIDNDLVHFASCLQLGHTTAQHRKARSTLQNRVMRTRKRASAATHLIESHMTDHIDIGRHPPTLWTSLTHFATNLTTF